MMVLLFTTTSLISQNRNWSVERSTDSKSKSSKNKIALIIANNDYQNNIDLQKPIPTAKELQKVLESTGFDVVYGYNLNRVGMIEMIDTFSKRLKNYDFSMVFYLGHGFQIDGDNFLIPTDVNGSNKEVTKASSINLDYLLKQTYVSTNTPRAIVLDACRDNPFKNSWNGTDRASARGGFDAVNDGLINAEIYFTVQKGSVVSDNNPYLDYFMEEMLKGECLSKIVKNTTRRVIQNNINQRPVRYGEILTDVCFGNKKSEPIVLINEIEEKKSFLEEGDKLYKSSNYKEALICYGKAALEGDSIAEFNIAEMYFNGVGTDKNFVKAEKYYLLSSDKGYEFAQDKLAYYYFKGIGFDKDLNKSFELYQKSADEGKKVALYNIALMYSKGLGVEKNNEVAFNYYKKAAKLDDVDAQYEIGYMLENGIGVNKNEKEASVWYSKSFDNGSKEAGLKLGKMYYEGRGVVKDYGKAKGFLVEVSSEGDCIAQYYLGNIYEKGLGGSINHSEAFIWYNKSSILGHSKSQKILADMYYRGVGVQQNMSKAVEWRRKSNKPQVILELNTEEKTIKHNF